LDSQIGYKILSHYNIYSNGGSGSTFNLLTTSTVSSGKIISGLTTGSTHLFKISAQNLYGEGPLSSQLLVNIATVPDPPAAVV